LSGIDDQPLGAGVDVEEPDFQRLLVARPKPVNQAEG
jgi:hypothetical protein